MPTAGLAGDSRDATGNFILNCPIPPGDWMGIYVYSYEASAWKVAKYILRQGSP